MADSSVRSDPVNVEQIMEQIRARIREKRGGDAAEQEIHEQVKAKLAAFLDPAAAHADLLDQLRKVQPAYEPPQLPSYEFEDSTLYESTRGPLQWIRRLLNPILKLFFNPNPLIRALNIQARLNAMYAEREAKREAMRIVAEQRQHELLHSLVVEMTRTGIETRNLRMRVESVASRLEFNERRTRALESATPSSAAAADRPARVASASAPPAAPSAASQPPPRAPVPPMGGAPGQPGDATGQRSRRRRRRRGRRGGAGTGAGQPANTQPGASAAAVEAGAAAAPSDDRAGEALGRDNLETFSGAAVHPSEAQPAREPEPPAAPSVPPSDTDQ